MLHMLYLVRLCKEHQMWYKISANLILVFETTDTEEAVLSTPTGAKGAAKTEEKVQRCSLQKAGCRSVSVDSQGDDTVGYLTVGTRRTQR